MLKDGSMTQSIRQCQLLSNIYSQEARMEVLPIDVVAKSKTRAKVRALDKD